MKKMNLIFWVVVALWVSACVGDPFTEFRKFKRVGSAEFPGLDPDGFMRRSEVIREGYVRRDGEWISPGQLARDREDAQ